MSLHKREKSTKDFTTTTTIYIHWVISFFSKIKMLKNRTKYSPSKKHYDKKNTIFLLLLWVFHCTCVPPKEKRESILFANI